MGGEGSGEQVGHEFRGNQYSSGGKSFKKSPEQAHKEYTKLNEAYSGYTVDERGGTVIGGYTGGAFREINSTLRANKTDDKIKKMENTINKAPTLPKGIELMRGVGMETAGKLSDAKVGTIIEDKGFQSFTDSPTTAIKFSSSPRNSDKKVVLRVVTKGTEKGISIAHSVGSMNQGEGEIILQHGTKWKISGKTTVKHQGTWDNKETDYNVIDLEAI